MTLSETEAFYGIFKEIAEKLDIIEGDLSLIDWNCIENQLTRIADSLEKIANK